MTADELVANIAAAFDVDSPPKDGEVINALVEGGVSLLQADVALKLVQIACGRILLDGLGIQFSDLYVCLDANGQVVERGELSGHPVFVHALARMKSTPRALKYLSATSADVQTVNQMMQNGSEPSNLATGPSALFVEVPTEAGLAAAKTTLAAEIRKPPRPEAPVHAAPENSTVSVAKPWWKVW